MSAERLRLELEELERWYRSNSCPSLDRESLSVLKLTVAGALGERWHEVDDAGSSQEDFRRRIHTQLKLSVLRADANCLAQQFPG